MRVKLRKMREQQGLRQWQMAELLGMARNTYTQLETGVRGVKLPVAIKIKQILNYKDDDLFDDV